MVLCTYAMYRQPKQVLVLLLTSFLCEITTIAAIVWQPRSRSPLQGSPAPLPIHSYTLPVPPSDVHLYPRRAPLHPGCTSIPTKRPTRKQGLRVNPLMTVLARDSLCEQIARGYDDMAHVRGRPELSSWVCGGGRGTSSLSDVGVMRTLFFSSFTPTWASRVSCSLIGTRLVLDFREWEPAHVVSSSALSISGTRTDGQTRFVCPSHVKSRRSSSRTACSKILVH